ncbi:MAG: sugar transferase [Sandaracinaceae bacterium]|nr:MAG: sugar transferase [Sandaracinaceae bacterium]
MPRKTPALRVKRLLDVAVSASGLVVLSPLLVGLTAAGTLAHGWPPLFAQTRPGIGGRLFRMRKLRTMTDARDGAGRLLPDDERLTRYGALLRATSLDELPELWHVLRGDMSLVGPRPLLARYLERYSERQTRRHAMPPGITGWAQVNGRNSVDWERRLEMDVWYVENWSLGLDLRILVRTAGQVLRREGISEAGSATMSEFMGSPERSCAS